MAPRPPTPAATAAARQRMMESNWGAGDRADYNAAVSSGAYRATPGTGVWGQQAFTNTSDIRDWRTGTIQQRATALPSRTSPVVRSALSTGRSGGGGYGGGGGGGGGVVADPTMTQGMFDWITGLINSGGPQTLTATPLDLPDYTATFDPTMYNELETNFGTAVGQDRAAADAAYANLENYLNTNYSNAFNNGNNTYATAGQAPGASQAAMGRLMEGQGVDPALALQQTEGAAAADAGFANLWRILAANEDTAQRNRLNRVQTDRGTTGRAIDAAALQGRTGIGLARNQARSAFEQRAAEIRNEIAQQEAMGTWQNQNQVAQMNAQSQNDFRNQQLSAMLGLLPEVIRAGGAVTLPGQRPSFYTTPQDPHGWASIAAAQAYDRQNAPPRPTFQTTEQDPNGWASIAAAQEWDRKYGGG